MRNRSTLWAAALALVILLVGYVQYRWIERVSDAETQREASRLERGLDQIAAALDAEIARMHLYFVPLQDEAELAGTPLTGASVAAAFAARLAAWRAGTEFPGMIRNIVFQFESDFWSIDATGKRETIAPIDEFHHFSGPNRRNLPLYEIDSQIALLLPLFAGQGDRRNGPPRGGPFGGRGPDPFFRGPGRGRAYGGRPPEYGRPGYSGPEYGARGSSGRAPGNRAPPRPDGPPPERRRERAVVLDREYIAGKVIPELAARYSGRGSLEIEIREGGKTIAGVHIAQPDATVRALAFRPECLIPAEELEPSGAQPGGRRWFGQRTDLLRLPPQDCRALPANSPQGLWTLAVSHRAGSLGASVSAFRTRNMLLSFGVLASLAGAVAALWISARRAAELARRQMEFAMSVSHELRTPLTVIRLAGDNLAKGIALNPEQIRRYGETIRHESERLAGMVEQVLTFARAERPDFVVRAEPVRPEAIVDGALAASSAVLRDAGFTVLREVDANLQPVCADLNLMIASLTNLLVNAVRHGDSGKWVRVRVAVSGRTVEFEVADHGPGINRRDLEAIFRPFYRGNRTGGTPGTGLGLHLVRRIADAHHGKVTVESSPGAGTVVTVSLPVAIAPEKDANS